MNLKHLRACGNAIDELPGTVRRLRGLRTLWVRLPWAAVLWVVVGCCGYGLLLLLLLCICATLLWVDLQSFFLPFPYLPLLAVQLTENRIREIPPEVGNLQLLEGSCAVCRVPCVRVCPVCPVCPVCFSADSHRPLAICHLAVHVRLHPCPYLVEPLPLASFDILSPGQTCAWTGTSW